MVAYTFKGRFVEPIQEKTKRQTIRAVGKKRHAWPGDRIQVYTGDRFHPRKVGESTCQSREAIRFDFAAGRVWIGEGVHHSDQGVRIIQGDAALDHFARLDGFQDWQALVDFWAETHNVEDSWTGILITWGETFAPNPPAGDSADD